MAGFRKAERRKAKLRLAIAGPSGSGKTVSSLLIAYGLTGDWSKVGLVDTENGSGDLYANATIGGVHIGEYNILTLQPPYIPEKYIEAIKLAEQAGIEALIIDSASHAWAGEGGLLDQHGKIADRGGNSFAAWRQVTPKHNAFVEAMLRSNLHLITTLRAKTEYVQVTENGKTVVKKLGLAPIQRDGFEYEFTVFLDLAADHTAFTSKDRTSLLDGQYFKPSPDTGKLLLDWLESGADTPLAAPPQTAPPAQPPANKPANGSAQGDNLKWDNFWKSVGGMGYDDFMVHEEARVVFNKPDLQNLKEVITDQKQLNSFLGHLAKKAKEKAGAA